MFKNPNPDLFPCNAHSTMITPCGTFNVSLFARRDLTKNPSLATHYCYDTAHKLQAVATVLHDDGIQAIFCIAPSSYTPHAYTAYPNHLITHIAQHFIPDIATFLSTIDSTQTSWHKKGFSAKLPLCVTKIHDAHYHSGQNAARSQLHDTLDVMLDHVIHHKSDVLSQKSFFFRNDFRKCRRSSNFNAQERHSLHGSLLISRLWTHHPRMMIAPEIQKDLHREHLFLSFKERHSLVTHHPDDITEFGTHLAHDLTSVRSWTITQHHETTLAFGLVDSLASHNTLSFYDISSHDRYTQSTTRFFMQNGMVLGALLVRTPQNIPENIEDILSHCCKTISSDYHMTLTTPSRSEQHRCAEHSKATHNILHQSLVDALNRKTEMHETLQSLIEQNSALSLVPQPQPQKLLKLFSEKIPTMPTNNQPPQTESNYNPGHLIERFLDHHDMITKEQDVHMIRAKMTQHLKNYTGPTDQFVFLQNRGDACVVAMNLRFLQIFNSTGHKKDTNQLFTFYCSYDGVPYTVIERYNRHMAKLRSLLNKHKNGHAIPMPRDRDTNFRKNYTTINRERIRDSLMDLAGIHVTDDELYDLTSIGYADEHNFRFPLDKRHNVYCHGTFKGQDLEFFILNDRITHIRKPLAHSKTLRLDLKRQHTTQTLLSRSIQMHGGAF